MYLIKKKGNFYDESEIIDSYVKEANLAKAMKEAVASYLDDDIIIAKDNGNEVILSDGSIIYAVNEDDTGDAAINKLLSEEYLSFEEMNRLRKIAREDTDGTWFESRC